MTFAHLSKMPGPRAAKPTLQEVVPLREVPDQESKVLRARLWDPENKQIFAMSFSKDLVENKLLFRSINF